MKLVHEGMFLIYKHEIKVSQYIDKYQSFLTQPDIKELRKLMEKWHLDTDKGIVPCDGSNIVHCYEADQHDHRS